MLHDTCKETTKTKCIEHNVLPRVTNTLIRNSLRAVEIGSAMVVGWLLYSRTLQEHKEGKTTHKMLGHCNLMTMYLYSKSVIYLSEWGKGKSGLMYQSILLECAKLSRV